MQIDMLHRKLDSPAFLVGNFEKHLPMVTDYGAEQEKRIKHENVKHLNTEV